MDGIELKHQDTNQRIEVTKQSLLFLPCMWCCLAALIFWMPMIFFFAADNVLDTCEVDLEWNLKFYALAASCFPLFVHFIYTLSSFTGNKCIFKGMELIMHATHSLLGIGLNIAAVLWYNNTTDENCYDGELDLDHYINPRKLLLAWIIMGFVGYFCQVIGGLGRAHHHQQSS